MTSSGKTLALRRKNVSGLCWRRGGWAGLRRAADIETAFSDIGMGAAMVGQA